MSIKFHFPLGGCLDQEESRINNLLCFFIARILSSAGKELKDNFLKALAEREEANRNGKMSVSKFENFYKRCMMNTYHSDIGIMNCQYENVKSDNISEHICMGIHTCQNHTCNFRNGQEIAWVLLK